VDQALDEILGPDPRSCEDRSDFGDELGGGAPALPPLPVADSESPPDSADAPDDDNGLTQFVDQVTEPLPGDIGDLIEGVLGGLP
jgi:hypothetical protein